MSCSLLVSREQSQLVEQTRLLARHRSRPTESITVVISSDRNVRRSTPLEGDDERGHSIGHDEPFSSPQSIDAELAFLVSIEIGTEGYIIPTAPLLLIDQPRSLARNPRPDGRLRCPHRKISDTIAVEITIAHAFITGLTPTEPRTSACERNVRSPTIA